MLNWIKFITALFLALTLVLIVSIFYGAYKPIVDVNAWAEKAALQSGQVVSVDRIESYHGTQSWVSVFGANDKGESVAVFVDDPNGESFPEVNLAEGISDKQAIGVVQKEHKVKKILHASLGIEEEEPVW